MPLRFLYAMRSNWKFSKLLVTLLVLLLLEVLVAASFIGVFKISENVSWFESGWQAWQTITTVGYGNQPAETIMGRIATMCFGTAGILILPTLFAVILDYIIEKRTLRRLGRMTCTFKDGLVIFNYPGLSVLTMLIRELRAGEGAKNIGVCVVDNEINELPEEITALTNIHFVKGSHLQKETYAQAGLHNCKSVMIFPKDSASSDSDGMTLSVVKLVEGFVGPNTTVIPIIVDIENKWMFDKETKTSAIFGNMGILAAVQEEHDPFSAAAVQRILSNEEGANLRSFLVDLIKGWSWGDFQLFCSKASERTGKQLNPFCIVHDGAANACPTGDTVINEGDTIIVIAYNDLVWPEFEKELVACKEEAHTKYMQDIAAHTG